ncbi:MAG: tail fiber domain-containing protein [Bacteroidota bacterium]
MTNKLMSYCGLYCKLAQKTRSYLSARLRAVTLLSFFLSTVVSAQIPDTLVEIGDNLGNIRMRLHKNGAFMLGGNWDGLLGEGGIPAQGPGTRMMWYPEKGAFRAGYVSDTRWDDANIGYFSVAAGQDTRGSGTNSTAFGINCVASGASSFALGENNTASGAASVALGYRAHTNARQGSFVFGDRSTTDTIRAGVNHSATWRLSGGFRIFTSSNLSTGITLQSGASVSNWGQAGAIISTSAGAYLSTGGVWTNASDVNRKHHFETVSGEDILKRLRGISISRWSYRSEHDTVRHLGPMAQDFYAAFDLGNDERAIGTVDADGVALAGVQALDARTRNLSAQLELSKSENEALRKRLDALEKKTGPGLTAGLPLIAILGGIGLMGFIVRLRTSIGHKVG